jgi:hypothetical protein
MLDLVTEEIILLFINLLLRLDKFHMILVWYMKLVRLKAQKEAAKEDLVNLNAML